MEFNSDVISSILSSGVAVILTFFITYYFSKTGMSREVKRLSRELEYEQKISNNWKFEKEQLDSTLKAMEIECSNLQLVKKKFQMMNVVLAESSVIREFFQPVILMGPRGVGKTSLVSQLHSPWIQESTIATVKYSHSKVPVYDYVENDLVKHFANPDISVKQITHLMLDIYDFPGEIAVQRLIENIILEKAKKFKEETNKSIGLVLICVFDSSEASSEISRETSSYYNSNLFRNIISFVKFGQVQIDRLILVFNHFDKLKRMNPDKSEIDLAQDCYEKFSPIFRNLNEICSSNAICEVFSVLGGENFTYENKGANLIKGECSRNFVKTFLPRGPIDSIIPDKATMNASKYFV